MEQDLPATNETRLTRRVMLATLAALSTSLIAKMQAGLLAPVLAEEFLSQCATSLTACVHLMKEEGIATVEQALPKYLPALTGLAKVTSPWQQRAATLAAQGCFLMGLLKLHRLQFAALVSYRKQCVTFAKIADDQTLFVSALTSLGGAYFETGQSENMLHVCQEAERYLESDGEPLPLLLQSCIHMRLADAYARLSQRQEAERHLQLANEIPVDALESQPLPSFMDYGLSLKMLFEGFAYTDLGQFEQAGAALAQIDKLAPSTPISERIRVEIINQRGLVAVRAGEMDHFKTYLLAGVEGAKALDSEKRRQEALESWKEARAQWPHEQGISELGDLFF